MWTKRYICKPTKEEYFKTKHPVGTISTLLPVCLYHLYCTITGINSWWMIVGLVGCITLGIGLAYAFAVKVKIYEKPIVPVLCMSIGGIITVLSLFMCA